MEAFRNRVLKSFVIISNQEGQGFVEYIMIIGLVSIALGLALSAFKDQVSTAMNQVGSGV